MSYSNGTGVSKKRTLFVGASFGEISLTSDLTSSGIKIQLEMEFSKSKKNVRAHLGDYPTRLQLYKTPPNETISLKEFEELAEQRLKSNNYYHNYTRTHYLEFIGTIQVCNNIYCCSASEIRQYSSEGLTRREAQRRQGLYQGRQDWTTQRHATYCEGCSDSNTMSI